MKKVKIIYMKKSSWENEDIEFLPKRKVNNKGSWNRAYIIGTFYSNKMKKEIEYESLNEFIFYAFLELDVKTIRYYVQPLEIDISYIDSDGNKKTWSHIPDVLVFRQDMFPTIYQIKDPKSTETDKLRLINKACFKYAGSRHWEYRVIYPKTLPKNFINNINFLFGFLKKRKSYDLWTSKLIERLTNLQRVSISDLATSFSEEIDPLLILPIVYHLIATGIFYVDLYVKINEYSDVTIQNEVSFHNILSFYEGTNNANK